MKGKVSSKLKKGFAGLVVATMAVSMTVPGIETGLTTVFAADAVVKSACTLTDTKTGSSVEMTSLADALAAVTANGEFTITLKSAGNETVTAPNPVKIDASNVDFTGKITPANGLCVDDSTKGVYVVGKHEADEKAPIFNFDLDTNNVTFVCTNCGKVVESMTSTASREETVNKAATCTESGEKVVTLTYNDISESKTITVPALGHKYQLVDGTLDWVKVGTAVVYDADGNPVPTAQIICANEEDAKAITVTPVITKTTKGATTGDKTTYKYDVKISYDGKDIATKTLENDVEEHNFIPTTVEYKKYNAKDANGNYAVGEDGLTYTWVEDQSQASIEADGSFGYRIVSKCENDDTTAEVKPEYTATPAKSTYYLENGKAATGAAVSCATKVTYTYNDIVSVYKVTNSNDELRVAVAAKDVEQKAKHTVDTTAKYSDEPATHTSPGTRTGTCTICGQSNVEEMLPKVEGHTFKQENGTDVTKTVAPSCIKKGVTYKICTACEAAETFNGEVTKENYNVTEDVRGSVIVSETPAKGHTFKVISYKDNVTWGDESIDGKSGKTVAIEYECSDNSCGHTKKTVTYHQLKGTDNDTNVYEAITVAETKGADCTKNGSRVYTVKNEKDLNGEDFTYTENNLTTLKGDHKLKATLNFAVDGKTASAYVECQNKNCPDHYAENVACTVTAADNSDGSTTYTATSDKYEFTDNTKTLYDLTRAEITMDTETVDWRTFTNDTEDKDKAAALGLSVKINGVEISSDLYKVDYSKITGVAHPIAQKGTKATVSIEANPDTKSAVKAYGSKTSEDTVLVKDYSEFTGVKFKLDGKEITNETSRWYEYDPAGHKFEASTTTKDATIKYAIVDNNAEVTDADFTLDEATVTDAGNYDVYYRITKEDYNTVQAKFNIRIAKLTIAVYIDDATTVEGVAPELNIRVLNNDTKEEIDPEAAGIEVYTFGGKALDQLAVGSYKLFVRSSANYDIITNTNGYAATLTVEANPDNEQIRTGWYKENNNWYLYSKDGEMLTGWQKVNGTWYFMDENTGIMKTGWFKDGSTWYYLNRSGSMAIGWAYVDGEWYYMNNSGAMQTGWIKVNGTWYYLKNSGAMAKSEWVNGYWLGANGAWTYQPTGSWKQNSKGWWFEDTAGWYPRNTTVKINGVNQSFDKYGYWIAK